MHLLYIYAINSLNRAFFADISLQIYKVEEFFRLFLFDACLRQ
jgi:hypothetical protein